jgi:uncharacterized cofD-like protein
VSIQALRACGAACDAVVAMADDGGSSGMLRAHTGKVPPGDVRKCLVAMARDPGSAWAQAFRERFDYVNNHTLGNLMLTALEDVTGSFAAAIRLCEELLECEGSVYPSTLDSVVLTGETRDGMQLLGQSIISASRTALAKVRLNPARPPANPEAVRVILESDLIILGPGSLFTSIIPNLLVPGILEAISKARLERRTRTVFVCSLGDMQGETWGLTAAEHVDALLDHGMRGLLDVAIVHRDASDEPRPDGNVTAVFKAIGGEDAARGRVLRASRRVNDGRRVNDDRRIKRVELAGSDAARIRATGCQLMVRDLGDPMRPTWHDIGKLTEAFKEVLQACHSRQR